MSKLQKLVLLLLLFAWGSVLIARSVIHAKRIVSEIQQPPQKYWPNLNACDFHTSLSDEERHIVYFRSIGEKCSP